MEATVVVPTRNRHESLRRLLRALAAQRTGRAWEIVVVDDGSEPRVPSEVGEAPPECRIVRAAGVGPARARNLGWRAALGEVVLFTDDDIEPHPDWLESALAHLGAHEDAVGVEGPIDSPPWDPLRATSFENHAPGGYLGGNIALRRTVLDRLGGFYEGFRLPHCEDYDLGFRAARLGAIGFAPGMRVLHHPRPQTAVELARRGRLAANEVMLFRRHRERYGRARHMPAVAFPFVNATVIWARMARESVDSPRDAARWLVSFTLHMWHVGVGVARQARSRTERPAQTEVGYERV